MDNPSYVFHRVETVDEFGVVLTGVVNLVFSLVLHFGLVGKGEEFQVVDSVL